MTHDASIVFECGPINLDARAADELWAMAVTLDKGDRHIARILFPARPQGYVAATSNLAHYAYNKATAMRCRERGDMVNASIYETICEKIYDTLPDFARW